MFRAKDMSLVDKESPEIKVGGLHKDELKRRGGGMTLERDTHI